MLSLDRCRTLLGPDCTLSDAQIELLRDQIRVMAEITMNVMTAMECDAGMPRSRAEKTTIQQAMKRIRR